MQKPKRNKLCQPTSLPPPPPHHYSLLKKLHFSALTEKNALALVILSTNHVKQKKITPQSYCKENIITKYCSISAHEASSLKRSTMK